MKLMPHRIKTYYDSILGYLGVIISTFSAQYMETLKFWVPWTLGIAVTSYALYNQHVQSKINRKKLQKYNEDDSARRINPGE